MKTRLGNTTSGTSRGGASSASTASTTRPFPPQVRVPCRSCSPIGGPRWVTSGIGPRAQSGGSTPARRAARRANSRSNPAGVQTIRNRAGAPLRLVNVWDAPWREREFAASHGHEVPIDLEGQLPVEDVEGLVEGVPVECRTGGAVRHDALDHRDAPAALLAAEQYVRVSRSCSHQRTLLSLGLPTPMDSGNLPLCRSQTPATLRIAPAGSERLIRSSA